MESLVSPGPGAKSNWPTVPTRPPAARGTQTPTSQSLVEHADGTFTYTYRTSLTKKLHPF